MLISRSLAVLRPLVILVVLASCGSSIDDHIAQLDSGGDDQVRAKQELLLAKDRSILPLIEALDGPRHTPRRPEIVDVLVDLMVQLDDERIFPALKRHLLTDPDTRVRSRICLAVGLYGRPEFADAFMDALHDSSSVVRGQALVALRGIEGKLGEIQRDSLIAAARRVPDDADLGTRLVAAAIVARRTEAWLTEARKQKLKGQIAEADSLYHEALTFSPGSKRAALGLGLLYLENGQEERGMQVLRESGWLVEVPRVLEGPNIDGLLDDEVWDRAGHIGSLLVDNMANTADRIATAPSQHPTRIHVLYTDDALYLGAYCEDAHPESLVVRSTQRDHADEPRQDLVEFFFDPNLDSENVAKITINSAGAFTDAVNLRYPRHEYDYSWDVDAESAGHVGDDFWSIEFRVAFGQQPQIPKPEKGMRLGAQVQRGYREHVEWSTWTVEHEDMPFGWFVFE